LLVSDERTLDSALRQLNQFGYDLERLQFVAKDEIKLLGKVREEYDRFITVVTRVVELIRGGHVDEAREAQLKEARPLRFVAQINSRAHPAPRSDIYVRRTYSGRPSSSIRFSEPTAMATSVVCRPPVRERSASPITRL
jgi:hypothetical protein